MGHRQVRSPARARDQAERRGPLRLEPARDLVCEQRTEAVTEEQCWSWTKLRHQGCHVVDDRIDAGHCRLLMAVLTRRQLHCPKLDVTRERRGPRPEQ